MNDVLGVIAVFVLVLLNGFFVAAEFAIVKVRTTRIEELVDEGNRRARVAQHLTANLDSYLSATQLGITMSSLGLGWIGEPALAHLIRPVIEVFGLTSETASHTASAVTAFAIITFLHIVLGELAPKSLAIQKSEETSLWVAWPLRLFYRLFIPVIWLFNTAALGFLRLLGVRPATEAQLAHSEEELRMIIAASQEGGHIDEVEQSIMRRALYFGERAVTEIMVPRTEMAALPANMPIGEALNVVAETNHTRYPVYEEDLDNTVGYVHVKELYRASPDKPVRTLLRPIGFLAETTSIETALLRFQSTRTPLAIVVDEHGGTAGIVTIQDVIEELIGEVQDEFDIEAPIVQEAGNGAYSVDGGARVDFLEETLGLDLPDEGFPTLGGRVFEQIQRRPRVGDEVRVGNFTARVLEVDGMRISRVLLHPVPEEQLQAEAAAEAAEGNGDSPSANGR
ncbi:MAG: hemolysin family protein [Thermoleophilia bacterium]